MDSGDKAALGVVVACVVVLLAVIAYYRINLADFITDGYTGRYFPRYGKPWVQP